MARTVLCAALLALALAACTKIAGHPPMTCAAGQHAVPLIPGDDLTGGVYRHGYKCVAD